MSHFHLLKIAFVLKIADSLQLALVFVPEIAESLRGTFRYCSTNGRQELVIVPRIIGTRGVV